MEMILYSAFLCSVFGLAFPLCCLFAFCNVAIFFNRFFHAVFQSKTGFGITRIRQSRPCRMASNAHAALLHSLYQALSRFFLKLFDSTRQFTHSALNRISNRRFADPLRFRNFNITHAKNIAGIDALRLFIRKH